MAVFGAHTNLTITSSSMNPDIQKLHPYPFEKLRDLKNEVTPPSHLEHIALSIGEPKHQPPSFVLEKITQDLNTVASYPITKGIDDFRQAMADWLSKRFHLKQNTINAEKNIIPVNGTREALFAFAQVIVDPSKAGAKVLMPNPFYQIYEGAALLAGAEPYYLNCTEENNYLPNFSDVPATVWDECQLLYLCTPGNPTGAVLNIEQLTQLIELADKHDFVIASDECYSELYFDEASPPPSILEACAQIGRDDYSRCVVFHSLSKRSNLPGLRSGFVAGDESIIQKFLHYRTYHGCAMSLFSQHGSILAWQDEQHVKQNRDFYREKFAAVLEIFEDSVPVSQPEASFFLWVKTPICDKAFAQKLYEQQNITVLPGSFLARDTATGNPGENHVRIALVAPVEQCVEAARRIKAFFNSLNTTSN